jgi:DNA-binding transcriptional LysR family regulator
MGRTLYYKGIQLPQLRSFCAMATQGSFTAAARQLGLSKPTVWQQVRGLERELKVHLIAQNGRGIELTAEGHLLLGLIQPHVSGLDSLVRLFEAQRVGLQQRLAVASTPYLLAHHLPGVIQEFTRLHPSVRLHLQADVWSDSLLGMLDQRRFDLAIVPYHPSETRNPNVQYDDLFELRFTLLTARGHPLIRKRHVKPADLVQYPIIKGASYNHAALENTLRRHDLLDRQNVVLESGSTDIVLKYVGLGVGVAVLYVGAKDTMPPEVHARPFEVEAEPLVVALLSRKGAHLPEHVAAFASLVRSKIGGASEASAKRR